MKFTIKIRKTECDGDYNSMIKVKYNNKCENKL